MPKSEPSPNTSPTRYSSRLPRFQFSLAWLLIAMTVIAIAGGGGHRGLISEPGHSRDHLLCSAHALCHLRHFWSRRCPGLRDRCIGAVGYNGRLDTEPITDCTGDLAAGLLDGVRRRCSRHSTLATKKRGVTVPAAVPARLLGASPRRRKIAQFIALFVGRHFARSSCGYPLSRNRRFVESISHAFDTVLAINVAKLLRAYGGCLGIRRR